MSRVKDRRWEADVRAQLADIADSRLWEGNAYYQRATRTLNQRG